MQGELGPAGVHEIVETVQLRTPKPQQVLQKIYLRQPCVPLTMAGSDGRPLQERDTAIRGRFGGFSSLLVRSRNI